MSLEKYPCGVAAGEIISLREDLHYKDQNGNEIGKIRTAGEEAMILTGNQNEPEVVWIRWRDGEKETWDSSILDSFIIKGKNT